MWGRTNLPVQGGKCINFPEALPWTMRKKKLAWPFWKTLVKGTLNFVNYHFMWTNQSLYTILNLVSERDLDNWGNLQEYVLSGAKPAFSLGCRFSAPLWPFAGHFFLLCFTFSGWFESSKTAWFPEHQMRLLITFAQTGDEAPQPTRLNFRNLLS